MEENVTTTSAEIGTDLQNETIPVAFQSLPVLPFMAAIKVVIGVTGLVGNVLVVIVVYKYTKLFQQVNAVYIINQSFIDAVVSALLIVVTFVRQYPNHQQEGFKDDLMCKLWRSQILLWGLMTSSTYNLMAISIDRYMAIVHPMWHKVSFTKTKATVSVVFIWSFGIIFVATFVIPTTGLMNGRCFISYFWPSREIAFGVGVWQVFISTLLPILVHCVCYVKILTTLRKRLIVVASLGLHTTDMGTSIKSHETVLTSTSLRTDQLTSTSAGSSTFQDTSFRAKTTALKAVLVRQDSRQRLNVKAKRNVIKTLAIVTVCYIMCWVPNKIYIALFMLGKKSSFGNVYQATVIMVFINCCINPIIYIAKYDAFKKGLAMLFRRPRNSS